MALLSSLLGISALSVSTKNYTEAQRWLQERAAVANGPVERHKHQTGELLVCCAELDISDVDALAFCRDYVEKNIFWIEWEIYNSRSERCGFISTLRAGRQTALMNIPKTR